MDTLLLDVTTWDLVTDLDGNIAKATEPYSLAQDAASAIRTWLGEVYFDTTLGVPYLQQIFGHAPPLTLLKERLQAAAETVPGVASAVVYIASISGRRVNGQVQVTSLANQTSAAAFTVINPMGSDA